MARRINITVDARSAVQTFRAMREVADWMAKDYLWLAAQAWEPIDWSREGLRRPR